MYLMYDTAWLIWIFPIKCSNYLIYISLTLSWSYAYNQVWQQKNFQRGGNGKETENSKKNAKNTTI